jgi:hypothetical protein
MLEAFRCKESDTTAGAVFHPADLIAFRLCEIVSLSTPGQPATVVLETFRAVEGRRKPASVAERPRHFKCLLPKSLNGNDSMESCVCGS